MSGCQSIKEYCQGANPPLNEPDSKPSVILCYYSAGYWLTYRLCVNMQMFKNISQVDLSEKFVDIDELASSVFSLTGAYFGSPICQEDVKLQPQALLWPFL